MGDPDFTAFFKRLTDLLGLLLPRFQEEGKSYVTIASDYAWGKSSQEVQVDLLRRVAPQINLLAAYWPRLGQTRFNSFIVDMLAQKPDFVLGTIAGTDNVLWMRDAKEYGFFI